MLPKFYNVDKQTDPVAETIASTQISRYVNNQKLPVISLKFADADINLLIDTGSSISIVQYQTYQNVKQCVTRKNKNNNVSISTLAGEKINYKCTASLQFQVQNTTHEHNFYISEIEFPPQYQGICGYDMLKKSNAIINCTEATITMYGAIIPFQDRINKPANKYHVSHVRLDQKLMLQPHETTLVPIKISNQNEITENMSFTPKQLKAKIKVTP